MLCKRAHSDDDLVDDGRTIADMSGLDGPAPEPLAPPSSRSARDELGDPDSLRMAILGTLKAGLSIGMVYAVVFAIAIALMVFFWA